MNNETFPTLLGLYRCENSVMVSDYDAIEMKIMILY